MEGRVESGWGTKVLYWFQSPGHNNNIIQMASIFHKFIEVSANKPRGANKFPQFAYMEHDIRKSYKQLKDSKGVPKPSEDFISYWKEIGKEGREEQVALYFKWIELLSLALKKSLSRNLNDREAILYIKKSMIGTWERRKVKLSGLTLLVFSKKLREYALKCFGIRKSKNKDHFSLVMEVIMQQQDGKLKSFHVGTNNIIEFQEWYQDLSDRIDISRVAFFKEVISEEEQGGSMGLKEEKEEVINNISTVSNKGKMKTITELVIDKELKRIEDCQDQLDLIEQSQLHEVKEEEVHPNIINKLFPERDLTNFSENPAEGVLLQCEKQHRLYQIEGRLKIYVTISHCISLVFRAISESHKNWNPDIDVFMIKNKIGTENSALIYQKNKSKGFLYRERDFLYLRHCFSIEEQEGRERIFMVEKSIDSIHTPPFMTVARGEKELIWEIIGDPDEKECLLVVEGLIKGGGYMNASDNSQMTIKFFKKLLQLETYLKQTEYSKLSQDGLLFRERWYVDLKPKEEEEEFYSPREIGSSEFNSAFKKEEKDAALQRKEEEQIKQKEEQFQEFIKHTSAQNLQINSNNPQITSEELTLTYIPPQFAPDKTVLIPQDYLRVSHRTEPKPKGKQLLAEAYRGHHVWKGEWCIAESGGLNYIDEVKMREQRKVLTFIIKRIGKNILSGKGILNISLPVDIFCRESNIERIAMSFGYFPKFLEKVAHAKDPLEQLKAVLASSLGSSLIYLTMEKPFNPILGETYQAWVDGCPIYFEQISHHPPIAAYFMKGRGFELSGCVEAKMDISINSGTGINEGIFTVKFDNGRKFYFTTPPGELSGLTYGERKLCFVDKSYFWCIEQGLFLELSYNPFSKQWSFFGGNKNVTGEQKLADYLSGTLCRYRPEDLREFFTPKKNDSRKVMAIPKGSPSCELLGEVGKVWGRWTKYINFGEERLFDVDRDNYYVCLDEKYPLASHCNWREDIVYRRMNNYVVSQEFKEVLEVKQRKDRKLREQYKKKNR